MFPVGLSSLEIEAIEGVFRKYNYNHRVPVLVMFTYSPHNMYAP